MGRIPNSSPSLWLTSFLLFSRSTLALSSSPNPSSSYDTTPLLTLSTTSADYECIPTSACLPCSPSEMESEVCSIWGNRRSLSCEGPYYSHYPSPIEDPDAQHGYSRNITRDSTTTTTTTTASSFYEFEPSRNTEGEDGGARGSGYETSDEFEVVVTGGDSTRKGSETAEELAELREVLDAEKRDRRRRTTKSSTEGSGEGEGRIVYFERRAIGEDFLRTINTFEACPKVVRREQSDYFEFVLCNLFFALAGLAVLMYRQRTLAGRQFGKLVARIMQTEVR